MSTLKVDTLQNAVGENFVFNNRNLLINGGMHIWQRSTQETGINSGDYYTADRWSTFCVLGTGAFTQEQSTDVPTAQGFNYSLKMDCTTADTLSTTSDLLAVRQRIEGQNLQHLLKGSSSAKKVTLSFWIKSSKTGTYICQLFDEDNTRSISKSYSVNSANTWEKKELTFDGDTTGTLDNDNERSLHVQWWLAAGTDHTSGSLGTSWAGGTDGNGLANFVATGQVNLADSTSNELYITGCQLETGSVATDFEFEPWETTQRKCQRYYQKLSYMMGICNGTNNLRGYGPFPVRMRDGPTIGATTPYGSALNAQGDNVSNRTQPSVSVSDNLSNEGSLYCQFNSFTTVVTGSAFSQGRTYPLGVPANNGSFITAEAEL